MLSRLRCSRGSVLVLVAAAMFPIVAMMTFAIDVSHWFDYSRNLQNRADAAALAGGQMLGSCVGSTSTPGSTANGLQGQAGKWAQLYTGASVGESSANVPYTDQQVSAATTLAAGSGTGPGTGWNVSGNGYINNTLSGSPVTSPLTLRAGLANINNFWVALNGNNWPDSTSGNTSFKMNPAGSGATFCNSDPTSDITDKACFGQPAGQTTGPCAAGPMVDVKITQQNVPLFIRLFSLTPTIHAHARVALQGEASPANVRAIAVSDPGSFACVKVNFYSTADNSTPIATTTLTQTDPINFLWTNTTAVSVPIPSGANVYAQPVLSDCNGNNEIFDDSTNSGVEMINSWTSAPTAGQAPRITTGGIWLGGTCTAPTDQYFSVGDCNVSPTADVTFNPAVVPKNDATVTAVDTSTGTSLDLSPDNTGTVWTPKANKTFLIGDQTGQHPIRIDWTQTAGSINNGTLQCGTGKEKIPIQPCTGTFGVQQQAFGACNGCDQPDDSGPIVMFRIHLLGKTSGDNAFAENSTQQLFVTLQLAGIRAEKDPAAKATIIRFAGSTNHQTGLVDCGQGNGGNLDGYVIYGGCGPSNPFSPPGCTGRQQSCPLPQLNPLFVYGRGDPTDCSPANDQNTGWPDVNHQDCVKTTPGTRRQGIICALVLYITKQSYDPNSNCNSNGSGVCPANHWPNTDADANDTRKVTFILTSPADLAAAGNSPGFWLPIRRFATFYVTGWDPAINPACAGVNSTYPGTGKKSAQAGTLWGHWINDLDPGGTPNGGACDVNGVEPVNCVPVLTR